MQSTRDQHSSQNQSSGYRDDKNPRHNNKDFKRKYNIFKNAAFV
jgi:hypothetical protein